MKERIIIAIDGFSSTGKSTLAKMLSQKIGYRHINTGAMYRAVTLFSIRSNWIQAKNNNVDIQFKSIVKHLDQIHLDFVFDNKDCKIYMNGENVELEIKTTQVSQYVSQVSAHPVIRKRIINIQREIGNSKGVVMEGRDIGSVVFPEAELKLFITASIDIRAQRRYLELLSAGFQVKLEDVVNNLEMRDDKDSNRQYSPLIQDKDAILIDNTSLSIDQQLTFVLDLLREKKYI